MKGFEGKAGIRARIAGESVRMAFGHLGKDKFRTFLSLLGVSVGIFCVTAAQTVTESIQRVMRDGIAGLGGDAMFVEQIPVEPDLNGQGVFRWWKYASRPEVSWEEFKIIRDNCAADAYVSYTVSCNDGKVIATDGDWRQTIRNGIATGRGFTDAEMSRGGYTAMLGAEVPEKDSDFVSIGGVRIP